MIPSAQQLNQQQIIIDGFPNIPQATTMLLQDNHGNAQNQMSPPPSILQLPPQNNLSAFTMLTSKHVSQEKERIADRLGDFKPKQNAIWTEITNRFGPSIKQPELLSIANVLAQNANLKLDRDAKRRKSVLIKWFSENWANIAPIIDYVSLEDSRK